MANTSCEDSTRDLLLSVLLSFVGVGVLREADAFAFEVEGSRERVLVGFRVEKEDMAKNNLFKLGKLL